MMNSAAIKGQIHIQIVSAVFRGCTRDFALEIADKFIHFYYK